MRTRYLIGRMRMKIRMGMMMRMRRRIGIRMRGRMDGRMGRWRKTRKAVNLARSDGDRRGGESNVGLLSRGLGDDGLGVVGIARPGLEGRAERGRGDVRKLGGRQRKDGSERGEPELGGGLGSGMALDHVLGEDESREGVREGGRE